MSVPDLYQACPFQKTICNGYKSSVPKRFGKQPLEDLIIPVTSFEITMKKTFKLTHPKINAPRLVVAIKHEVRKYLRRERRKNLPDDVDFWDFGCRFGFDETSSDVIHVADIDKSIDKAASKQLESFYLEILAKPGRRTKKSREKQQINVED